jgi:hypothetical protein
MFESLEIINNSLRKLSTTLEPGRYTGEQAATLVGLMAETERLAGAVKALAAARVDESNRWRREGHRSAAHWMAAKTGTSVSSASEAINTAKRIKTQPHVDEAFRNGELSPSQAGEISATAAVAPNSELDLLRAAKSETLTGLREKGRRTRHAALPNEIERDEAIRRSRYFRSRTSADGAFEAFLRLTPLDGARFMNLLDPYRRRAFDTARRTGTRESYEAYAADAVLAMAEARSTSSAPPTIPTPTRAPAPTPASPPTPTPRPAPSLSPTRAPAPARAPSTPIEPMCFDRSHADPPVSPPPPPVDRRPDPSPPSGGPVPATAPRMAPTERCGCTTTGPAGADIPNGPTATVDIRVDWAALRRGHTIEGDVCEIRGIGPIPVATARMLAADSIINVLFVDGVEVTRVAHSGRTVNAHQRSALRERTETCEVPWCDARENLEIDHDEPWALSKTTSVDDLNVLCRFHHHQKTHNGYRLTGPPGDRRWHPPAEGEQPHAGTAADQVGMR